MRLALLHAVALLLLQVASGIENDIALVIPPKMTTGKQVGIMMLSGAAIANTAYQPMLEAIQESAASRGLSLFVGAPWYAGNVPNPVDLAQRLQDVQNRMQTAGLATDAPMFYAAHSLGTVFIQDHVKSLGSKAAGQILMGGFLQRKYLVPEVDYSVPTLTLAGELDGLARVTRMAESFYHQRGRDDLPVVVLSGSNHMQFASGAPPSNVRKNDLAAEISEASAHAAIAEAAADFIVLHAASSDASQTANAQKGAAARQKATSDFMAPIIAAYELEGSRRFNMPNQVGGYGEKTCSKGLCSSNSPWAPEAQKLISTPPVESAKLKLKVTNSYVLLSGSPVTGQDFHLPTISNSSGEVEIITYSQCYWNDQIHEILDDFDTGFIFTSAQEIGTKLASRQCTANVGLGQDVDFSVDAPDFCAQTNQLAYEWALAHAPAASAARFKDKGIPFVMGADKPVGGGPWWLDGKLEFKQITQDGNTVMQVSSVVAKTEQDYWKNHFGPIPKPSFLPDPGCYHYCKLLSPARAMEWLLVDGIRPTTGSAEENDVILV